MRTIINLLILSLVLGPAIFSRAEAKGLPASSPGEAFATPEEAVSALVAAAQGTDITKLQEIFGSGSEKILSSGDPVMDHKARETFVNLFNERHSLETGRSNKVLLIGEENWPFPIPLVERDGRWRFDTAAGAEEIVNRRIGGNELSAIELCRKYVRAQEAYYSEDRDGDGVKEYARYLVSAPGKRDGLFWARRPGEAASPLGPVAVQAFAEGYLKDLLKKNLDWKPQPYRGYYFRILKSQGASAPGGKKSYVSYGGAMTEGFALVAYPARWGVSGIMTFIVNQNGQVFEKNLGPGSESLGAAMQSYNPDSTWKLVG